MGLMQAQATRRRAEEVWEMAVEAGAGGRGAPSGGGAREGRPPGRAGGKAGPGAPVVGMVQTVDEFVADL